MDVVKPDYARYKEVMLRLLGDTNNLPNLPEITLELRAALARSDASVASLSKLISYDPQLSEVLLRYATSVMLHNHMPPQSLFDVVRILGMTQVERIALLHAVKHLFSGTTQAYTRVFVVAWDRLVQKAAISALIAKKVGQVAPDNALLGSLMSEVGTLAVLSQFRSGELQVPEKEIYINLCREFAKTLGIVLLEKWDMGNDYIQLVRQVGNWHAAEDEPFGLLDVVNLGLYHSLKLRMTANRLPHISSLAAYDKLSARHNAITDTNELELVVTSRDDIRAIADSLY